MTTEVFILRGINAVPWTSPRGSVGRKGGKVFVIMHKGTELEIFQQAVREVMAEVDPVPVEHQIEIRFFIWRQLVSYESETGRKVTKHRVDATNVQKALEDALQGVLYKNDNQVRHVETWMMEQEKETEPCIVIEMRRFHNEDLPVLAQPQGDKQIEFYAVNLQDLEPPEKPGDREKQIRGLEREAIRLRVWRKLWKGLGWDDQS